jgi:hypothetical protein
MNLKLIPLLLLPALMLLLLVSCGGRNPLFTISDVERIGFTKFENTTSAWTYEGLLESWNGEITTSDGISRRWDLNGISKHFGVLIFDQPVDKFTKDQFTHLGLSVSVRTAVIHNIAISCHSREVCDYAIEKLR